MAWYASWQPAAWNQPSFRSPAAAQAHVGPRTLPSGSLHHSPLCPLARPGPTRASTRPPTPPRPAQCSATPRPPAQPRRAAAVVTCFHVQPRLLRTALMVAPLAAVADEDAGRVDGQLAACTLLGLLAGDHGLAALRAVHPAVHPHPGQGRWGANTPYSRLAAARRPWGSSKAIPGTAASSL